MTVFAAPEPAPPLPAGYRAAPLARGVEADVATLVRAQERADLGAPTLEEADVVADWQRPGFDVATSTVGIRDADGALAGYAEVSSSLPRAEVAVHPDHRGRGLGTWLAHWVREAARGRGHELVGQPVPADSPGDRLLAGLGYGVRWTSWVLRLPAGAEVPDRPLPAGYTVRAAEPPEYRAVQDVLEDAFLEWSVRERETFEAFEAGTLRRPGFEPWQLRVLLDPAGTPVGAAVLTLAPDEEPGDAADAATGVYADIDRLAVRRELRGRGLAQALMVDAFAAARAHGATACGLNTDSRTGALGLYRKVGMEVTSTWVHRAARLTP